MNSVVFSSLPCLSLPPSTHRSSTGRVIDTLTLLAIIIKRKRGRSLLASSVVRYTSNIQLSYVNVASNLRSISFLSFAYFWNSSLACLLDTLFASLQLFVVKRFNVHNRHLQRQLANPELWKGSSHNYYRPTNQHQGLHISLSLTCVSIVWWEASPMCLSPSLFVYIAETQFEQNMMISSSYPLTSAKRILT